MNKIFAIICFIACLQLLSFKPGYSTAKNEPLIIYSGKGIQPKAITSSKSKVQNDTVSDIDGNVYHVVKIGKQRWMLENLKTAHFSDGSAIPEVEYYMDWPNTGYTRSPAWCYYERNAQNNNPYGKLYNWYAVADRRNVCPAGWHVPSDVEFQLLSDALGGNDVSGAHLKDVKLWDERAEKYADNTSGFTALPAGIRYGTGSFGRVGADGADFWSSSPFRPGTALCRILYYEGSNFSRHYFTRWSGLSVRCMGN